MEIPNIEVRETVHSNEVPTASPVPSIPAKCVPPPNSLTRQCSEG